MNRLSTLLALTLFSGTIAQFSTAQAQGTAFTYQGQLNSGTNLANGSYDFQFGLWSAASGPAQLGGLLTNSATGVTNGLFTVTLDFGSQFPGANRWLEISVRTNGGGTFNPLAPRQPLTPAPYAITAGNLSGTVSAAQLPAGVVTNNAVGLNLSGTFIGNGANVTNVNAATLGGIGSTGFWKTNGNAGTDPAAGAFLGTADNQPLEYRVNGQRALRLEPTTNTPNVIGGYSGNTVSNGFYGAFISGGGRSGNPQIIGGNYSSILGGIGNVASGTYSMAMGVTSKATNYASTAIGDTTLAGGIDGFALGSHTVALGQISAAMGFYAQALNDGSFVWADSTSSTPFASSANNQFLIRASGGVGIGTTNPAENLTIGAVGQYNSGLKLTGSTTLGTGMALESTSSGGHKYDLISTATGLVEGVGAFAIYDETMNAPRLVISATGNVGLGTPTPASDSALQVKGLVRMGSETGTTEAPNKSILVRRINSSSMSVGQVVARNGVMTLERDGTPGGFVIKIAANGGFSPVFAATGLTYNATPVNVYTVVYNGGAASTNQIFTTAQKVGHFSLSFGDPADVADMVEVTLTRFVDNAGNDTANWVGSMTSTVNQ